jgi:hypothetical protein
LQYAYELGVAPGRYNVWPGQTIRVVYHEWIDGYHAVNIDDSLWVLEVRQQIDSAGVRLVGMIVATVDRAPANDYTLLARWMQAAQTERGVTVPESRSTNRESGVPVSLTVVNGMVTSVGRGAVVTDGWYDIADISKIQIRDGYVVYVETSP